MTKLKVAAMVLAVLVMTGCRAAARSTVAALQQKVTLTQSTFRDAEPVAPRRADAAVAAAAPVRVVIRTAAPAQFAPAVRARAVIVRNRDCGVIFDMRQGNVSVAAEPRAAFEKVSS